MPILRLIYMIEQFERRRLQRRLRQEVSSEEEEVGPHYLAQFFA